jgi:hypothetical protein
MEVVEAALLSLHLSFYALLSLTIIPIVATIPRAMALAYLVAYALCGVWVVYCSIPEKPAKHMGAQMDERTRLLLKFKLQDA